MDNTRSSNLVSEKKRKLEPQMSVVTIPDSNDEYDMTGGQKKKGSSLMVYYGLFFVIVLLLALTIFFGVSSSRYKLLAAKFSKQCRQTYSDNRDTHDTPHFHSVNNRQDASIKKDDGSYVYRYGKMPDSNQPAPYKGMGFSFDEKKHTFGHRKANPAVKKNSLPSSLGGKSTSWIQKYPPQPHPRRSAYPSKNEPRLIGGDDTYQRPQPSYSNTAGHHNGLFGKPQRGLESSPRRQNFPGGMYG